MCVRVMMVVFLVSDGGGGVFDVGLVWFVFDCVGSFFGFYWEG